jgi:hypothetical protein
MASADEEHEMADLITMMTASSKSTRESPAASSKYSRFHVSEEARQAAAAMREEKEALRRARAEAQQKYVKRGEARKQESRETMAKHRATKEARLQQNVENAEAMKHQAFVLKMAKKQQQLEHMERGRLAAERDEEQRDKIRQVRRDNFKTSAERMARAKQDEFANERTMALERERLRAEKHAKVAAVRQETAEEVLDAAKFFAYNQKRALAAETVPTLEGLNPTQTPLTTSTSCNADFDDRPTFRLLRLHRARRPRRRGTNGWSMSSRTSRKQKPIAQQRSPRAPLQSSCARRLC